MRLLVTLCALLAMLCVMTSSATADPVVAADEEVSDPDAAVAVVQDDPVGYGKKLYDAFRSKDYWYAFGLVLCLLTLGFRFVLRKKWLGWFSTNRGGLVAVCIVATVASLALAIVGGEAPSFGLVGPALAAVAGAIAEYTAIKKAVDPAGPTPDWV